MKNLKHDLMYVRNEIHENVMPAYNNIQDALKILLKQMDFIKFILEDRELSSHPVS